MLRKENAILKEEGAVGGAATTTPSSAASPQPPDLGRLIVQSSHELSADMRMAAATAESNLRYAQKTDMMARNGWQIYSHFFVWVRAGNSSAASTICA